MELLDLAIYRTVHEFTDGKNSGATALGPAVNMVPGTLNNKADPAMVKHHLSLKESRAIQLYTQDFRILYAYAADLKHTCIQLGDYSSISDIELLDAYAKLHQEIGEMASAISNALADGKLTRDEFRKITKEMRDVVRVMFELESRLEAIIDED